MRAEKKIKNIFGEDLDVLIEGNPDADKVLIFVHGFGTDKNEGFSSFLDAAEYFKDDYITVRFDQSGYGDSEGEDYEFQFQKAAGDLDSIIRFARQEYPKKELYISAHSLGAFVTALLCPFGIKKIVLTSIGNSNTEYIIEQLQERILAKGGKIDENAITRYPRTSGAVQLIGRDFWRTLRNFNPVQAFEQLGQNSDVVIFKPKQDEVLENKHFEEYRNLKNVQYLEIDGDHNFKKPEDREHLMGEIKGFLKGTPMIKKETIEELRAKYPGKNIFLNDEENPTEVVAEVEPEAGRAVAIIERSVPHFHEHTEERYTVLKGELDVFVSDKKHHLKTGETLDIKPGPVHYAVGNETWVEVLATPPWSPNDHILVDGE